MYMSCRKDELSAMAYNETVSETIGFKTRDLELAIFQCSEIAKGRWRKLWIKLVIVVTTYVLKQSPSPVIQGRYVKNF